MISAAPGARRIRSASPRRSGALDILAVLYRYRALVLALLGRQVRARYRGSALGFFWTFLNPLLLVLVYALVFRLYMRLPVPNYAYFLLAALLPWIWFTGAVTDGANSIVAGGSLITKSLFPAEILPAVVVLAHLVNFLFTLPLLLAAGVFYGVMPHPGFWVGFPIVVALQLVFTLGLVLALAALNVRYRDVQHILGNLLLLWFFFCPIVYPVEQIPEPWRVVLWLNPVGLLTEAYRGFLLGKGWPPIEVLAALAAYAFGALAVGARVFDARRDAFAELV